MGSVKAVRGAIRVDVDTKEEICRRVGELIWKLSEENSLYRKRIISIQFTQTKDLISANPATALRTIEGYANVPLFCAQEPEYEGSMERVIRILVTYEERASRVPRPVYLNGAERLRGDLFQK
jgi:chorismate mutase